MPRNDISCRIANKGNFYQSAETSTCILTAKSDMGAAYDSTRNESSLLDNGWLKLLLYDWFEDLSDKFMVRSDHW